MALLSFDNLTGDASLDWLSAAAPNILAEELTGAARTVAVRANAMRDAYLAGATKVVHGYFDRRGNQNGELHFEIPVEDVVTRKIVRTEVAQGDPLAAMSAIAKRLDENASGFSSSNAEAVQAWGRKDYERAVALDPGFGAAWYSWAAALAPQDAAQAESVTGRALANAALRSPIDRARIQLLSAELRKDTSGKIDALKELTRLIPADGANVLLLAQAEMNARRFAGAAQDFREAERKNPGNANIPNLLGYAEAYAGNLDAAKEAYERYAQMPGQETNALDSQGEALFMNGKFEEAAKFFMQAAGKDPSFLNGAPLWKAALSRHLGANPQGAEELIRQYLGQRQQVGDPLAVWRGAVWLYLTGRKDQAMQMLSGAPPNTPLAQRQLAVWREQPPLPQDPDELKKLYEQSSPDSDGLVRTFYATALLRAGRVQEARALVRLWPLPDTAGDVVYQPFLYPMFQQLRKQLGDPDTL